jgi:hypothetical protein
MDVEKNGGRLFRRTKLTLSCSAEGKEGKMNCRLINSAETIGTGLKILKNGRV